MRPTPSWCCGPLRLDPATTCRACQRARFTRARGEAVWQRYSLSTSAQTSLAIGTPTRFPHSVHEPS